MSLRRAQPGCSSPMMYYVGQSASVNCLHTYLTLYRATRISHNSETSPYYYWTKATKGFIKGFIHSTSWTFFALKESPALNCCLGFHFSRTFLRHFQLLTHSILRRANLSPYACISVCSPYTNTSLEDGPFSAVAPCIWTFTLIAFLIISTSASKSLTEKTCSLWQLLISLLHA